MSGDPKTLTLTFEETVEALGREGMEFRVESPTGNGVTWAVHQWSKEEKRVVLVCCCYGTWPEAASDALGVPVVARDEAAELSEAVREVARMDAEIKAEFDWNADSSSTVVSEYRRRRNAAWERALGLARRLASEGSA